MHTILFVEDAIDLADAVEKELTGEGYRVIRAGDGKTALIKFQSDSPDLILLDWMLPEMDGLEVLRQIRQSPRGVVPILMLTARSEEIDRVLGLELGADDYLTKPFGMRELKARIRALFRRSERIQATIQGDQEGEQSVVRYGPFFLDPSAFRAEFDSAELELTRTEFKLLHLLLRNPGRVFSREYLLDSVWGEQHFPGDRSVDNTVLRLRKKLGAAADIVESVWGVGYRLRPLP